ncbi:short-chain dehydrogenase [Xylogone sp. PMI_703]|nr:short-chain dehydrogenase [Xylogone sp. PMI_703]
MSQFGFETNAIDVVKAFPDQVKGRTCPSPGGLGAETAISLAHGAPKSIILIGRNAEKCRPTVDSVHAIDASIDVKVFQAELSSLKSVRKAARAILDDKSISTIDVIINNAGIMAVPLARNENGYEMHFAANHLGHFLLTNLLMPKLTPQTGRVVNVASSGNLYSGVNWDDVHFRGEGSYKPMRGYSQSKTANILFSVALKKRGIKSYAVHPGSIQTPLVAHLDLEMAEDITQTVYGITLQEAMASPEYAKSKTLQQGCATQLVAALDPSLEEQDGVFLNDCCPSTSPLAVKPWSLDEKDAERMWMLSEELVGESFEF